MMGISITCRRWRLEQNFNNEGHEVTGLLSTVHVFIRIVWFDLGHTLKIPKQFANVLHSTSVPQ
jgi:hypothetical protein